jgi:hypothetical protein
VFFLIRRNKSRKGLQHLGTGNASPLPIGPGGATRNSSGMGMPLSEKYSYGSEARVTDQRLDPSQVWSRYDGPAGDRASIGSLEDGRDYTRRVLRVTNSATGPA